MIAARVVMDMLTVGTFLRGAVSFFWGQGLSRCFGFADNVQSGLAEGMAQVLLQKQNPGGSPFPGGDSPWPHPILCGMFGSKTDPPSSVEAPCWSMGRVAVWAGSVPPGKTTSAWSLCGRWQELTASSAAWGQRGLSPDATSGSAVVKGAVNQARSFPVLWTEIKNNSISSLVISSCLSYRHLCEVNSFPLSFLSLLIRAWPPHSLLWWQLSLFQRDQPPFSPVGDGHFPSSWRLQTVPGSDYSSAWLAPAPLWAEIQAKRSPGTQGGAPWGHGSGKVAPQCLKQPVQCGSVCQPAPELASWNLASVWHGQPSQASLLRRPESQLLVTLVPLRMCRLQTARWKRLGRFAVCALILQIPCAGAFPSRVTVFLCSAIAFLHWVLLLSVIVNQLSFYFLYPPTASSQVSASVSVL